MNEQEQEVQRWKRIAAYLASCHAATLEGLPKRTSKRERDRYVSICTKSASMLRGKEEPRKFYGRTEAQDFESDIERCENAAKNHRDTP